MFAQKPGEADMNTMGADSAGSDRVQQILNKYSPQGSRTEPKLIKAEPISAPPCFAGWRFFKVTYVPALPQGTPAAVPLLRSVVAIRGSSEEFLLPGSGDYSEFGKFLNYNRITVRSSVDMKNVTSVFSTLYGKQFDGSSEQVGKFSYIAKHLGQASDKTTNSAKILVVTKPDGTVESFKMQLQD